MNWSDEATEIMTELLAYLPSSMREEVGEKAEIRAEALSTAQKSDEVSMEEAIAALVECTPSRMRPRLREALNYHGVDPEVYEMALEAE